MTMMFSWLHRAVAWASTMKRSVSSGLLLLRNLIATLRPSLVSRAAYTAPMPPRPSSRMISYCPIRVPGSGNGDAGSGVDSGSRSIGVDAGDVDADGGIGGGAGDGVPDGWGARIVSSAAAGRGAGPRLPLSYSSVGPATRPLMSSHP